MHLENKHVIHFGERFRAVPYRINMKRWEEVKLALYPPGVLREDAVGVFAAFIITRKGTCLRHKGKRYPITRSNWKDVEELITKKHEKVLSKQ